MTCTATLKPLKRKWYFSCSLIAPQTQVYDNPVILALKFFIRTLVLAFKSPNTVFVASLLFSIS